MANIPPIQFKRSHHAGAQPTPAQLAVGELSVNMIDGAIWTKDSDGNIISLGSGSATAEGDSDVILILDSDGNQTGSQTGDFKLNIITEDVDGNTWQNNPIVQNAPAGARINLFRRGQPSGRWSKDSTIGTNNGWGSVVSTDGITDLNYAGVQSYAVTPQWFSASFPLRRAYEEGADFATSNDLNNMWYWQFFETPVTIGDGTDLGSFQNGRTAYNEYYNSVRVEFLDVNGNTLATQAWSSLGATGTRTINVAGTINNVRSVMFRAHLGNASNPGLTNIRLKVNGSNDYPTTTALDNLWGAAYRNMVGATNLADSDEALCLVRVQSTAGSGVGGAWNVFRTNDWRPFSPSVDNQVYTFWFNKPWDFFGGTFANGRNSFQTQFWDTVNIKYFDSTGTQVFESGVDTPAFSLTNKLFAHRDIWKIEMRPTGRNGHEPVIQRFFPDLGYSKDQVYTSTAGISDPEIWIKNTNTSFTSGTYYLEGAPDELPLFTKIST